MVNRQRPVYLDITKYKFPITAIVSILHRISGVIIFLFIPFLLWALDMSLQSGEQFQALLRYLDNVAMKLLVWILLAAIIFHWVAGIRHLLMDVGVGESHYGGRMGANIVIIISIVLIILSGIWLW